MGCHEVIADKAGEISYGVCDIHIDMFLQYIVDAVVYRCSDYPYDTVSHEFVDLGFILFQ